MPGKCRKQVSLIILLLFGQAFQEIDPNAKLASIFGTVDLKDKINFNSSNEDVLKVLDTEVTGAIDNAFNILRNRIDRFGVVQPNITQLATKGRILIDLPGQTNPKSVYVNFYRELQTLSSGRHMKTAEIIGYLSSANDLLKEIQANTEKTDAIASTDQVAQATSDTTKKDQSLLDLIGADSTKAAEASTREEFALQNPLFGLLNPRVNQQGQPLPSSMVGLASSKGYCKGKHHSENETGESTFPT